MLRKTLSQTLNSEIESHSPYNGSLLRYKNLPVLKAPSYKDLDDDVINPKKITWFKKFDFDFTINKKSRKCFRLNIGHQP